MRQFLRSTIGTSLLISLGLWLIASGDFVGHGSLEHCLQEFQQGRTRLDCAGFAG